ncbi:MAG: DUF4105 domain-containing protein [Gammaproteobacteria bacterium]|nr:DUF4105 domain-containing protein [Gammaproteobacteria bacterium]
MRRTGLAACLMLFVFLGARAARAGVVDAPGADLEISLITYGPGRIYWERFGHDALQVRDRLSGQSVDFNYGVFDFDERGFFWNFARGYMHYMIDVERSDLDEADYVASGRSVVRQRLALTPAQAVSLRAFLLWNLRPENAIYNYDYLTDNCTTRVRDALDKVLGGALRRSLAARPGGMTYRQQIDRLMSPEPGLMLAMDMGLGPAADRPLSAWQESFLPMVLEQDLRGVKVSDGHGGRTPLVSAEQRLAVSRIGAPPARPPALFWPLGLVGTGFAILLLATRRRLPRVHGVLAIAYVAAAGFVGLVLAALWGLTQHHAAWENANLLVFNPLAFWLPAAVWRRARGGAEASVGRGARRVIGLQLVTAAIAVLLHGLPLTVQQNQPWLALAIPIWLAIALDLRPSPPHS